MTWLGVATHNGNGSPATGLVPLAQDGARLVPDGEPVDVGVDPMYLAWAGSDTLVVAHEADDGAVSAWRTDGTTLQALGPRRSTFGAGPCHVDLDPTGRWVLVANYTAGVFCVLPFDHDGGIGPATAHATYDGSGPHPDRQDGPHAHQVVVDSARDQVLVADLGTDRLHRHRLDARDGSLSELSPITTHPGAGPRHLVIAEHLAYVAGELDATVLVVDLSISAEVRAVPSTTHTDAGAVYPSAIRQSPDGSRVYVANRGPDSVATFAVTDGTLELIDEVGSGGEHPRDMVVSPDGRYLWVANQFGDNVASFEVDENGCPQPTGDVLPTPSPTCILLP